MLRIRDVCIRDIIDADDPFGKGKIASLKKQSIGPASCRLEIMGCGKIMAQINASFVSVLGVQEPGKREKGG